MTKARQLALNALMQMETQKGYSNLVIDEFLSDAQLTAQDKALASGLFYGVLERKYTLDAIIKKLSRQSKTPLKLYVRLCLRMGMYQIFFMDKIPPHAAINEAVEAVKGSKYSFATGFVNGVLRSALRQKDELLPQKATPDQYRAYYSVEDWIVKSFIADYGQNMAEDVLEDALRPSPMFIRVNTLKTTAEQLKQAFADYGVQCQDTILPNALRITGLNGVAEHPLYLQGLFHVQDLSSQLCAAAISPESGQRVLDVCAAPGGKSFTIAQEMQNTGCLVSLDLHAHRAALIAKGAKRLGLTNIQTGVADATVYNEKLGTFSKILCDVPCSGLGVIRHKPEIKYLSKEQADALPGIQKNILNIACKYLQDGGTLVYSTCTLRKAENSDVVQAFLAEHPQFIVQKEQTIFPWAYQSDGFYICVLKKEGAPCL